MRTIRTPSNRAKFLEALMNHGIATRAAEEAGISRVALYDWKKDDPDFDAAWEAAMALGVAALEDHATSMAFNGSEKLVMFLLTAKKPDLYGNAWRHRVEVSGKVTVENQSLAELKAELAQLMRSATIGPVIEGLLEADQTNVIPFRSDDNEPSH